MINHITYHLSKEAIGYSSLEEIMNLIGFEEFEPNDPFEHGYDVRWFRMPVQPDSPVWIMTQTVVHFVADDTPESAMNAYNGLGLGHFCVIGVGKKRFDRIRKSDYCPRDSGSGRCWLEYDNGRLRIEVRP